MPLNYKSSYKERARKRNLLIIIGIVAVCLIVAAVIIFTKKPAGGLAGDNHSGEYGKVIERQKLYLYTVGTPRVSPSDVNREYTKVDKQVEDSYFDDALFIGDSRTEGFMLYTSLSNIKAYCSKGLSISRIYEDKIVTLEDGRTVTVMDALQEEKYKKIYIMFGVNELGWPYDDLFIEQYTKLLHDVKQLEPDAIVYVENIIPVSAARSATDPIYNNDNVRHFNEMVEQVCKDQNVVYLDVASALAGPDGALPANASTDGVHCNKEFCEVWLIYLKNNTYEIN